MFVFGKIHDWQNEQAVKQMLVFSSKEMKAEFEEKMKQRLAEPNASVENVSDSGIGSIYKLRAVKNSDDLWIPIIRCGFIGKILFEGPICYHKPELALQSCLVQLFGKIALSVNTINFE